MASWPPSLLTPSAPTEATPSPSKQFPYRLPSPLLCVCMRVCAFVFLFCFRGASFRFLYYFSLCEADETVAELTRPCAYVHELGSLWTTQNHVDGVRLGLCLQLFSPRLPIRLRERRTDTLRKPIFFFFSPSFVVCACVCVCACLHGFCLLLSQLMMTCYRRSLFYFCILSIPPPLCITSPWLCRVHTGGATYPLSFASPRPAPPLLHVHPMQWRRFLAWKFESIMCMCVCVSRCTC